MHNLRIIIVVLSSLAASLNLQAQSISNIRAIQSGDDIQIFYDLNDPTGTGYIISIYCSTDGGYNWGSPLSQIEGDANKVVMPGLNRKAVWKVLNERNELVGNQIQFEIRAQKGSSPATAATAATAAPAFSGNALLDNRDGQSYQVIKVNNTYWMAENLNFNTTGSFCYANDAGNCEKYGRLYTWDDAKKACPEGWRLAEEKEWKELESSLGMPPATIEILRWRGTDQGEKLKKGGPLGFDALYGGFRSDRGLFDRIGLYGYFWSGSEFDYRVAYCRLILYSHPGIYYNRYNKTQAMSVRCVRN